MFDRLGLDGVITTKLDEATSLGGLLSLLIARKLMVGYVTDGQGIPEDIRPGARYRADFISQAVKLACTATSQESSMADQEEVALTTEPLEQEPLDQEDSVKEKIRVTASG